jgi:hypothetical protein
MQCAFCEESENGYTYGLVVQSLDNKIPINSRIFLMKKSAFSDSVFVCEC